MHKNNFSMFSNSAIGKIQFLAVFLLVSRFPGKEIVNGKQEIKNDNDHKK